MKTVLIVKNSLIFANLFEQNTIIMKKHLLIFIFLLGHFLAFSQNAPTVYVDIQAPLPVCNPGELTTLQADYLQTYATNTNNYDVTSIPYAPQYPFTGGTLLNVAIDDIWSPIVDLPFPFCFYGQNYTKLLVGANGVLSFNIAGVVPGGTETPLVPGDCDWSYTASIPSTSFPIKNAIYGVYQDIHPGLITNPTVQNINYYVTGTYPNRAFVLNTAEIPQYSCNTSVGLQTYQIILYETTNTIDVLVNKRTACTGWNGGRGVIGLMNQAGTLASVPPGRNTGTWSAFNEAWRFTPSSAGGSNVTLNWHLGSSTGPSLGSANPLTVSPTVPTTYTAVATYTRCDGTLIQIQDDITVGPEPNLPTLDPQDITICTSSPGPYTFNINQNIYMANGYATPGDFVFRYYVDSSGAPGAQIPNATLNAYTPASSTYPQTIWVEVEEQGTVTGTGCINLRSFQLNVTAGPSGSFSYSPSTYCESITTPQATTLSGLTSGGVYSATPAGLIIDATTGAITPNGSTPGTYTVHYDIGATGSCPAYSAPTVNVTINPAPIAPVVVVVQPTCTVTTGSITVTSPLGAGYEYSIDNGANYQSNPSFTGVVPNTYSVVVRDISSSCVSPVTPVTINTPPGSPAIPLINTSAATCTANGSSTITNYDATLTYTFTPAGPSVGAAGAITGMVVGTSYTVVASNTSCSSAPSASFSNDAMLIVPVVPTISSTAATCTSAELSAISNYDATLTYTFTPAGPSVGASGAITGMVVGTSYTVVANNTSCSSAASASFSNDAMLSVPAIPTISSTAASCTSAELSAISNYDATLTYTFTPPGPSVGAAGAITGMVVGTSYTVIASNTSCSSASSASFSNDTMLVTPAVPTTSTSSATCAADGSSTITNYVAGQVYTFSPSGPTVGAGGVITGMTAGTNYTVTAGNGSCRSAASAQFNNPVKLTTPAVPLVNTSAATCTANGSSTISNYVSTLTYTFTPAGPSVGAGGAITGMVVGTSYSVVASNTSCSSVASSSFSNGAMLPTPQLVITNPAAVCAPSTVDLTNPAVTAGSIGGGTLSYWTNSSATTPLANPNAVAVGGTYYIQSTSGTCKDIEPVVVTINSVPVVTLTNGYVCVEPNTGAVLSNYTINTNLSVADYSFQWTDGTGTPVGSGSSYIATAPGTYNVVVTSLTTGCGSTAAQATVGTSSWPQALDVVTSEYFADVMSINVMATPAGNYEYSIDGGNFQSSSVFVDVAPGEHTITVRDINQCGDISITTTLIDYPRYFTPNGDGYHDTWNISALKGQSNSKIHIFDRFGKLLKEIRPSSSGWNGTFNGQELPSTDYWFVVFYQEKGQNKEFKSHFSLKR